MASLFQCLLQDHVAMKPWDDAVRDKVIGNRSNKMLSFKSPGFPLMKLEGEAIRLQTSLKIIDIETIGLILSPAGGGFRG